MTGTAGTPGASGTTRPVAVMIGPPGSGKSKVGRTLAAGLGVTIRDTDADIEAHAGKPVSEIFVDDGEPHFRELESAAVLAALTEHDGVVSLGGGAVMSLTTQAALTRYAAAGGHVVFLDVPLAIAAQRVGMNQARQLAQQVPADDDVVGRLSLDGDPGGGAVRAHVTFSSVLFSGWLCSGWLCSAALCSSDRFGSTSSGTRSSRPSASMISAATCSPGRSLETIVSVASRS